MVVVLRRTTLSCNAIKGCSSLHSSPSSDISESVFGIASGQYAKSKFDWEQETPQQRSAALSTVQSLHSGTLPRLDTLGFQVPNHYSACWRAAWIIFPSFRKKNPNTKNISYKLLQKKIINKKQNNKLIKKKFDNATFTNWNLKLVSLWWFFALHDNDLKF